MEAILSATSLVAKALKVEGTVGSLEPGKEADLIAVQGNPIEDISVLRAPKLVMKRGILVPSSGRNEARVKADTLRKQVLSMLEALGID